jgi:cobyrinic acid a,c-diamide synthase
LKHSRIVIAGSNSGAGKTTVTLGLLAALQRRGLCVQGFKVGPDYIDPSYHTAVTGRASHNLDTWMMPHDAMREIYARASDDADVSVIEGVMGMYDGKSPLSNVGSTAEVSVLLQAPVILVINAASMARSAAAVVLGFQQLDRDVRLAGVIVNQVGSPGHYELVKAAIEQVCQIPVLGYLTKHTELVIPERHLGLIPALERGELTPLFDQLADTLTQTVDVDKILDISNAASELPLIESRLFAPEKKQSPFVTLAVARDSAFNFYYPDNLDLLEWYGARIHYFQPLAGESIPEDVDGVYLGGGFPEEFTRELSQATRFLDSVRRAVSDGMPVYAECGGFMALTKSITPRVGESCAMVGVLPATTQMQNKLAALGYREVTACQDSLLLRKGETARGHEFHYSRAAYDEAEWPYAYKTVGLRGSGQEGYAKENLLAAYTHLHFASNPQMISRWLTTCSNYQKQRKGLNSALPEELRT